MRELAGIYPISRLMLWTPRFPRKTKTGKNNAPRAGQ